MLRELLCEPLSGAQIRTIPGKTASLAEESHEKIKSDCVSYSLMSNSL